MIGEASSATNLINNERVYRDNQVSSESKELDQDEEAVVVSGDDFTSFSSEALALARKVVPVNGSAEDGQIEQQGRGQEKIQDSTSRFLDIRV